MRKAPAASTPAAAGPFAVAAPEDEAPVSTGCCERVVLVEPTRALDFPLGIMAASTSGKSDEVNPAGTNGSARIEGDILHGSTVVRFGGVDVRLRGAASTVE